jgi:ABC-type oligopeptide transport system substrate-binding subunit
LAAAGFPEGVGFPQADLMTVEGSPILRCIAEELSRQMHKSLGIDVNIKYLPQDKFRDTWLNEPPHIWLLGWQADYSDADNFLRGASWLSISRWRNQRYEELVEEARRVTEPSERFAMYHEAELILEQEAPLVPLYYLRYFLLAKPWLKNLIMPADGTIMAQHLTIDTHD